MKERLIPLRNWFFEEGDASAAAAMRIAYGATCLFMLWDLYPVMDLLLGHGGYFGTLDPAYIYPSGIMNLLFRYDSPPALRVWFWSFVGVAICITVGLFTRVALVTSVFFLVLCHERNPFMVFGADGILLQISLWLPFLKAGRVWSLDRAVRERLARPASRTIPLWPLKVIQLQMALVYFASGLAKIGAAAWQNGSAVYYALNSSGSDLFPGIMKQKLLLTLMTYGTLWIELSFAFLVFWKRTRWIALASAVLLHVGIDILMAIRFFGVVMYLGLLSFVQPSEWLRVQAWAGSWFAVRPLQRHTGVDSSGVA